MTTETTTYQLGDAVQAEVLDGDWRVATVIGERTRANGQTFYRLSVGGSIGSVWMTAKRIRKAA